ncbi:hypothetical protein BDB00DRAFT_793140 [Zychaea mexicana]|uniref:uncharacterized protein n=1 Tax=Zychaea mexicana TaxID=64656 RepID=UPI0022FEFF0A|nr:uncharacterized protein BDB00DRAFT_793140 [Zychaea mexicana]KAI9479630.1 hypothetical protein BDB00DRAFT_793140 [Zychaea mexicana]
MVMLQAIAGFLLRSNSSDPYGSKIDLLAATTLDGEQYDLCSNKWKREGVCDSVTLKQQAKNLRTNATILSRLINMGCSKWVVAMDWTGVDGYAYILSFRDGIFVAHPYANLMVPKRSTQLKLFRETLDFMFKWKHVLLRLATEIDSQPGRRSALRGIVKDTSNVARIKTPTVVITPKSRKRSINEISE